MSTARRQRPYRSTGRRRSRRRRPLPRRGRRLLLALGGVAFLVGLGSGARHEDPARALAERYAEQYARRDWPALRDQLTAQARRDWPAAVFARRHREALETATATEIAASDPVERDGGWAVPLRVTTRSFGTIRATLELPTREEAGGPRVAWRPHLAFPGLRPGERLARRVRLTERARLLARDGTVLAEGDARTSPDPELAASVVGQMGTMPSSRREELLARGVPADARVGLSGLERAFDDRLRGVPGGVLLAGSRPLAARHARRGRDVRTTISPTVQRAAVAALGPRLGGVVVIRPRTGALLAFAGIPFSGLQPPGSTFKVITAAAALQGGVAEASDRYPVTTAATIEGVPLQNANGELCGGTLVEAFAESCNSVFGPLGVEVGPKRLVATAERFGFNRPPDIPGVAESSLPAAGEIGDELAVASTAIGQGRVQATTVEMTSVAATIALRGRRPRLTLDAERARTPAPTTPVTDEATARTVARLMRAVVTGGTGTAAAIPGVRVAGKTGTAELRSTQCTPQPEDPEACTLDAEDQTDTTAWFVGYAPAGRRPKVAVGVMLVGAGAGGDSAAPAARSVLLAALGRGLGG